MGISELKKGVNDLYQAAELMVEKAVPLEAPSGSVLDFKQNQEANYRRRYVGAIEQVKNALVGLRLGGTGSRVHELDTMVRLINSLDPSEPRKVKHAAEELANLFVDFDADESPSMSTPAGIPSAIRDDIHTDLEEISRCFEAQCYRSAVILCGRVLEVALHRKYYDTTGVDALEKSPGIGLGNLLGKMRDKGVTFDPAINQQIHLVNQVRVFSVHKKQQAFTPSKEQAQAIILYTQDVLKNLFG